MLQYKDFISENVALSGVRRIGIYNENGNRVGQIPLNTLTPSMMRNKQYSFGALSDVHIIFDTAESDFQKALTYLNNDVDVVFTCICGDLTENGTEEELAQYKAVVDAHSADTPVYAIAGNHERYDTVSNGFLQSYTGKPLYYSFTHNNDVFIMCGCYSWTNDGIFTSEYLQWLYETLEVNRNKRCFIFEHVFPWGDSGNPGGLYYFDIFSGTKGSVFQSLLKHYKNTILFHGHSHSKFDLQELDAKANYSDALGYRSVHIPSLSVPRDIVNSTLSNIYADSEGYVVDVYENGIHLRGRDFVKGEFLPIASYWLDTTLQTVPAGMYKDSTGTITI
jgi:predicted phosphodiesterase